MVIVFYDYAFNLPCDLLCYELHLSHVFVLAIVKIIGHVLIRFLSLGGGLILFSVSFKTLMIMVLHMHVNFTKKYRGSKLVDGEVWTLTPGHFQD